MRELQSSPSIYSTSSSPSSYAVRRPGLPGEAAAGPGKGAPEPLPPRQPWAVAAVKAPSAACWPMRHSVYVSRWVGPPGLTIWFV